MSETALDKILVVDDVPEDLQLIVLSLKENYTIVAATTGEMGVELAQKEPQPKLVLMDVTMPGMSGYEACTEIKKASPEIDVIFISANDSTEEVMQGFDVGGIDYIIKPIEQKILMAKIKLALEHKLISDEMRTKTAQANKTALLAMTSSAEQAIIIDFLRDSFACETHESIAHLLLNALSNYYLTACVQLHSKHDIVELSHSGDVSPVESELMGRMRDYKNRTLSMDKRLFLNYDDVTLFVKDMPIEDEKRYGRLRDYLQTIIHGAAVKQKTIELNLGITSSRNTELGYVAKQVQMTLQQIKIDNETHKTNSVKVFDRVKKRIEESFLHLGLTEEQEQHFIKIINEAVGESLDHFEVGLEIDTKLKNIIGKLSELSQ